MAAPAFGAMGTRLAGATSTAANISVPTTPAADANSLDIVNLYSDGTATTLTAPDGTWTQAGSSPQTRSAGGPHREHIWYKRPSANSGTYNFVLSNSVFREAVCFRLTGVIAAGNPFDVTDGNNFGATTTTAWTIVTTGADRLLVFLSVNFDTRSYTPPTNFIERFDLVGTSGGTDTGAEVATLAQAAAGSSGAVSATLSGAGGSGCCWLGAVLPPAGAAIPTNAFFAML